jgi:hypothetical protein
MATVSEHLVHLIARQVEERSLVVWYDPGADYRAVAETITIPQTTVALYTGSFLELRHRIDHLLNDLGPPRLLVYVPLERTSCHNALIELEAAGVVMQPGQQPPARNTRLSVLARNALKGVLGDEGVGDIERQVEAGKLTLADLNTLASKGEDLTQKGVVTLVFGTGNAPEVALAFLASDRHDPEIAKKAAGDELRQVIESAFDVALPHTEPLAGWRERLARHVLATDLLTSLQGAVPATLASVKTAAKAGAREACGALARTWRLRRDARDSYVAAANKVEQELKLAQVDLGLEQVGGTETFLAVERAMLRGVESSLLHGATADLLARAEEGKSRFWSEALPAVQAHWALVAAAAQVLLEADRVEQALKKPPATAEALFKAYTDGASPWCLLDTCHRRMEKRWYDFEPEGDRHQALEQLVRKAEGRYMDVGCALAQLFLERYRQAKQPPDKVLRQTEVFDRLVRPRLASGKTAYVWVDALRYEMARELCQALAADFEITVEPGVATAPTITEVGMASLLPHGGQPPKVVAVGGGKLGLVIDGTLIKDRKDRVSYLKAHAGAKVFDAKLDDLLPRPPKRVREGVRGADLVLLTSQEIDELCEQDNLTQARRQMDGVLVDLRRGLRALAELGVRQIVLAADHGHLFGDELGEDMKIDSPGGETADLHRRVWVGKGGSAEPSYLRLPLASLGVDSELDLATPWTFACFKVKGGARAYFHGGLSPQELIIPVVTLAPKAAAPAVGGGIEFKLQPGSKKISTRFFSVQVTGVATGLFGLEPPKVRVEARAKGKPISTPVSASYGFEDATGDVQLQGSGESSREVAANTVTLMIGEEPGQKTVGVFLLDAATGAELASIREVEVAISL